MGISQTKNLGVKNPRIQKYFDQFVKFGFCKSRILKISEYKCQYCRGSKSWMSTTFETILNELEPVLLSPCLPNNFDALIQSLIEQKLLSSQKFMYYPKTIGMILSLGNTFPTFKAEKLGTNEVQPFSINHNVATIFVFWRLDEEGIKRAKELIRSRSISSCSKDIDGFIDTAFIRAKQQKNLDVNLIGICQDSQENKNIYEQIISTNDTHIWINEKDQSAQVFRYAEEPNQQIRQLEQSIYIVNQNGIFVGCLQENFGNNTFINEINNLINGQINQQDNKTIQKFQEGISKNEYKKIKNLILIELKNKQKLPVGDTFNLSIKKHKHYINHIQDGVTYFKAVLNAAGSEKYAKNCNDLIQFLKQFTPIIHMERDLKKHHSMDKYTFFQNLNEQFKNIGLMDITFILEKSIEIQYNQSLKEFEMIKQITSFCNTPKSISSVFSRRQALYQLSQSILNQSDKYSHKELHLLKGFFGNPYYLKTLFKIGTPYSPIPNTQKKKFNSIVITQSKNSDKGQYQSEIQQKSAQNQHDGIQNLRKIHHSYSGSGQYQNDFYKEDDLNLDLNYDLNDSIHQINDEVLIIFLIDFTLDEQIEHLKNLFQFIKSKQWDSCNVRVIGLERYKSNYDCQIQMNSFQKEIENGILEIWYPIKTDYIGIEFNKMLDDLYGLNTFSPSIMINHLGKLHYQGKFDQRLKSQLNQIINQGQSSIINSAEGSTKWRIDLAQFENEWYKIKQYGILPIYYSTPVKDTKKFLEKMPMIENEFWKLSINQFQVWYKNGQKVKKYFEKPKIKYKFERNQLGVKFYDIIIELQRLLGEQKIDVIDESIGYNLQQNNVLEE